MKKFIATIKWLIKTWPIMLPAIVGICHYLVYLYSCIDISKINKIISAVSQIVGGIIVVYSINQNLGSFRNGNIFSMIVSWIKDCPLVPKNYKITGAGGIFSVSSVGNARLTIKRVYKLIDERLDAIEIMIEDNAKRIEKVKVEMETELSEKFEEIKSEITKANTRIDEVGELLKDSMIGGIDLQVFGVCLVIYGAIIGLLS